jgi:hypothetical protein
VDFAAAVEPYGAAAPYGRFLLRVTRVVGPAALEVGHERRLVWA